MIPSAGSGRRKAGGGGIVENGVVFWVCWGRMVGRVVIDDCRFTIYYLDLRWGGTRQRIGAGFRSAQEGNLRVGGFGFDGIRFDVVKSMGEVLFFLGLTAVVS